MFRFALLVALALSLAGCASTQNSQQASTPSENAAPPNATPVVRIGADFGPKQPDGVNRGNWIQTMPAKGWFTILRLYNPLEPFFTKTWRPSEIELVK